MSGRVAIKRKIRSEDIINPNEQVHQSKFLAKSHSVPSLSTVAADDHLHHARIVQSIIMANPLINRETSSSSLRARRRLDRRGSIVPVEHPATAAARLSPPQSVAVTMKELGAGDIFGDDCIRDRYTNTYSAVAIDDAQIILINKKEALDNLKGHNLQQILEATQELHMSDIDLILKHESAVRKQLAVRHLKEIALGPLYTRRATQSEDKKEPSLPARQLPRAKSSASMQLPPSSFRK
jgi:CRP-like cAMP-binding protein